MKILILGADGYLGWPTAMYLNKKFKKSKIFLLDNFVKRKIEFEQGVKSLFSENTIIEKLNRWNKMFPKKKMYFIKNDLLNNKNLYENIKKIKPNVIIHYAEQPSAPYSMIGREEAVFTQQNNVIGTLNLIFAIKKYCPDCHLVKLGTMGEYGTPNIDIEEGYLNIKHNGRKEKTLFPKNPGSIYHLSKVHDSANLYLLSKIWNLKCTDLNQGVVYGSDTEETLLDEKFKSSFHYDHIFGTILNRFIAQVVTNSPLLVYGSGNQVRSFLNIKDTLRCIELAIKNPAKEGEMLIRNQFTEIFKLSDLALKVKNAAKKINIKAKIKKIINPRIEMEGHYYNPKNRSFKLIGLKPTKLNEETLIQMITNIIPYKRIINKNLFSPKTKWKL